MVLTQLTQVRMAPRGDGGGIFISAAVRADHVLVLANGTPLSAPQTLRQGALLHVYESTSQYSNLGLLGPALLGNAM